MPRLIYMTEPISLMENERTQFNAHTKTQTIEQLSSAKSHYL